jgi:Domain of unknown function (DUF3384)/Rap/ran-GAP/Tuberin
VKPDNPVDIRQAGFDLLTACVKHISSTDLERKEYFDTLISDLNSDDFHLQLAAVVELTKHGKDLSGFHYDVLPLLSRWLRTAWKALEDARKISKQAPSKSGQKPPLGEETNLHRVFEFVVEVLKFNFIVSVEDETSHLIDEIIYIAFRARISSELRDCVGVLDAIVTYGSIPSDKLQECVKLLCSIHCVVPEARDVAWRTIRNLCRSHNGHTTVRILLDILRFPVLDQISQGNIREIRGSITILEKIMVKKGQKGYPVVPFALLMDALANVVAVEHAKVESEILRLILSLFDDNKGRSNENVLEEDWASMFEIARKCSLRASETSDGRPIETRPRTLSPTLGSTSGGSGANVATSMAQTLYRLIIKIEEFLVAVPPVDFFQRENCVLFFAHVHAHLPESCAKLVIDYYTEFRYCYPSDPKWQANIQTLLDAFFLNRSRSTQIRLQALKAVTDVYEMIEMMDEHKHTELVHSFVSGILNSVVEERDIAVLERAAAFAVAVADTAKQDLFEYIVKQLHQSISSDQVHSPVTHPGSRMGTIGTIQNTPSETGTSLMTTANVTTKAIIRIFMRAMDKSSIKALRAWDEIHWIAKSNVCETDARLSAMKMLFRLRADWANRIFLIPCTESETLASSLNHTKASLAKKHAEDETSQSRSPRTDDSVGLRTMRSASYSQLHASMSSTASKNVGSVGRTLQRNQQMWMYPDPEALPEVVSENASMLLVSAVDDNSTQDACNCKSLKVNIWLETVIGLLQQGCDWEIFSFILVHLPSQLTNQALFRAAVPQIKLLRNVICQQIKNSSFHEPPISSGLRKSDVAVCLFQLLTIVMSYHKEFSRNEEDEIVKMFVQGMNTWERAAKCCIHALSICCHELPNSVRPVLVDTLHRMSQIITQSHVAVHILEFLACLARLPDLYSNFREDDYRIVFMICFRYLQYAREKAQDTRSTANRNSTSISRNTSAPADGLRALLDNSPHPSAAADDLPQYVYALTYHNITFWFLCLRLPDRASQVSWIIKNLVWTDISGRQEVDEQAQVTMNFMQRTAYADIDESAADPTFTTERFGEIVKKTWLIGLSIITIEQATRGGRAQVTKRQPSGTSHYIVYEKFERPPAHQVVSMPEAAKESVDADPNIVLPNHLLVQLTAPRLLTSDSARPIPLPDDDMIRRAISTFDRIPTVDCHKVGVIYIGENQTHETEILANVMGSSDYTDFLSGLGIPTKLQGATFNTQGLDRQYNTDGEYTFCWRDRVTEMVFHVTTLMPTNLDHDPRCSNKKRHIGNDYVNIIFNNSGHPFRFDTFPSEFNFVYIVITPESRASFISTRLRSETYAETTFYKVQVMSKKGFPEISPAAETKIMSLKALPDFIRLLALNASVFSLVWANRAGGEHMSPWRNRLREIVRLREKYGSRHSASSSTISPPNTAQGNSAASQDPNSRNVRDSLNSLRRSSVATFLTNTTSDMNDRSSRHFSTAETEVGTVNGEESMVEALDFSKWA